jgi:hypothetical protein
MTEQPTREQLLHLADRARRGVALPAEHDALHRGITEQAARIATLELVADGNKRHVQLIVPDLWKAEAAIERVLALADRWALPGHISMSTAANDIRAALDQPQQPPADDYEQTTGHQITCCAGFTDICTCDQPAGEQQPTT